MAVSKKKLELTASLTAEQKWQVEALESRIDNRLGENYTLGGQVLVHLANYHPDKRVRMVVVTRYCEQGWKISFQSDQEDGYWITLE